MNFIKRKARGFRHFFESLRNKKPCYIITENGVHVKYYDFSNREQLPFDPNTYENCQIFIGNIANPVKVQVQDIIENADELSYDEAQSKGFEYMNEEHIIFSQRYKQMMLNKAYSGIFAGGPMNNNQIKYLLYGILALIGLLLVVFVAMMG